MHVRPHPGPLGADVVGVDLAALGDDDFEALYRAWLEHGVLRIRGQRLSDPELEAFSARFGPLEEIPVKLSAEERARIPSLYVTVISNIQVGGRPIGGLGNLEAAWHSDMTYTEKPPPASVLHAVEVPDTGGDTWFSCQVAALAALHPALRARAEAHRIKHDATHTSVGELRRGYQELADLRALPGAVHPIVKRHEETGREALFLGRRDYAWVVGMELPESEAFLDELWRYAALPGNVWKQTWRVGDVVVWDNRRVLHRRDAFAADARRLMKRCQVLAREA
jgi:taurine dioxygenase